MRSNELARLAGVTVRTLRHYHQIGLLEEPPRTASDYRDYDVHDLVRVLRIKRLAALGLPLRDLPPLLDDEDADAEPTLAGLDRELAAEIDRLTAQREVIAVLRRERAALDLPAEFARHARLFDGAPGSAMARFDREQIILLAHLAGEAGLTELARFYDNFSSPEMLELVARTSARFDALDDDTDPAEVQRFVDETSATLAPIVRDLGAAGLSFDLGDHAPLLADHSSERLNATQSRALAALEERFADALDADQPASRSSSPQA